MRLWGSATRDQARDTGMALVLLGLIAFFFSRNDAYITAAATILVLTMAAPRLFRPAAVIWFGLAHVVGAVVSRVMLSAVFFAVVTPIGLWRRAIGADALQLKLFGRGRDSVMKERNHTFVGKDLEQPY